MAAIFVFLLFSVSQSAIRRLVFIDDGNDDDDEDDDQLLVCYALCFFFLRLTFNINTRAR